MQLTPYGWIGASACGRSGNLVHLLEAKGIRVFSLAGERGKQVDAYSLWCDRTPFVFLNTMKTPEHGRMDAAHELGHLVLHRHGGTHRRGRDVEMDAHQFGAAFLMPAASVRSVVPRLMAPTMPQLIQLKLNWKGFGSRAGAPAVYARPAVRVELPGGKRLQLARQTGGRVNPEE